MKWAHTSVSSLALCAGGALGGGSKRFLRNTLAAIACLALPVVLPAQVLPYDTIAAAQAEDIDDDDFDDDDFDEDDFADDDFGDDDFGDDDAFEDDDFEDDDDDLDDDVDDEFDNDDDDDFDDDDDYDDQDYDEYDDDERDFGVVGLEPDDFEFDEEGFPARSNEILAFDLGPDDLAIAQDLGFEIIDRRELSALGGSLDRLRVPPQYSLPGAVDALEGALPAAPFDYNHIYVLPEGLPSTEAGPITPLGEAQSGSGIRIGVIDTLVDTAHPSLVGQAISVRDFASGQDRDRVHGTAVASILVGSDDGAGYSGLVPGAQVFAANVFAIDDAGLPATDTLAMVEALDWLSGQDVGVVSISIAGPDSAVFAEAIERVQSRGQVVVAAVGNDGPAAPPLFPAAYDGVVGVTAIDLNRRVFRRAGRGEHVDFSAPGVRVRAASGSGDYAIMSGTSFATPVVAALIALRIASRTPTAGTELGQLNRAALDLGQPGKDTVFGYGLLTASGGQ